MTKPDFKHLDDVILRVIKSGKNSFTQLQLDGSVLYCIGQSGSAHAEGDEWRVLDRRLQSLRKRGAIRSVKGKLGPVWEVVQ